MIIFISFLPRDLYDKFETMYSLLFKKTQAF